MATKATKKEYYKSTDEMFGEMDKKSRTRNQNKKAESNKNEQGQIIEQSQTKSPNLIILKKNKKKETTKESSVEDIVKQIRSLEKDYKENTNDDDEIHSSEIDEIHSNSNETQESQIGDKDGEMLDTEYEDNNKHIQSDVIVERDYTVFAKGVDNDITRANTIRIQEDICKAIGRRRVDISKAGISLRIKCLNDTERSAMISQHKIGDVKVTYSDPFKRVNTNLQQGIIFGVDIDISEEELKHETDAFKVKRITKKISGLERSTKQIILFFENEFPQYVKIGWKRFRVSQYIPDPIRCYNCQRYGHRATTCRSQKRCSVCAGSHNVADCQEIQKNEEERKAPKCSNCGGKHPTSYKGCPNFKIALQITKVQFMAPTRITYAEATKKTRQHQSENQETIPNSSQIENENKNRAVHKENQTQTAPPSSELKKPSTESKGTSTDPIAHNECVKKDVFQAFLKKCEIIFRESIDRDEKIRSFVKLIEQLAGSITSKIPETNESTTNQNKPINDENSTNQSWTTIKSKK